MKKNFALTTLVLGFAALVHAQPAATAQPPAPAPKATPPPPTITGKIAVIRTQQAVMSTKEGIEAQAVINAKFEPKKTEFAHRDVDIKALEDQLRKGATTMSDEAKARIQRDYEAKKKLYDRDIEDANADLELEMTNVMNQIGGKMVGVVVAQYAAQNGYAAVLDVSPQGNSPVLWVAPSIDITADIIKLYDQTYPGGAKPAAKAPGTVAKPPATPAGGIKKQ